MGVGFRDHRPGDRIRASDVNDQNAEIRRLGRVRSGAGLDTRDGPGGLEIAVSDRMGGYGFLAAGTSIGACSGMTLGKGTLTLCSRLGDYLTDDGIQVTVYNSGGQITGGASGKVVAISLRDGEWSTDVAKC